MAGSDSNITATHVDWRREGMAMNLDTAIQAHTDWKTKFRFAITKHEFPLDVLTISKDNCCELGRWLNGEAKTKYDHLACYRECVIKHSEFHTEAAKIASVINAREYNEALIMMNSETSFWLASNSLILAIIRLRKETGF